MEIWKDIEGFEGYYKVSSEGRVLSLAREHRYGVKYDRIMTPKYDRDGYTGVVLCKDGKGTNRKIHRLVGLAFIDNPFNKEQINHKNAIKDDNRVDNLEWMTPKENSMHAWRNGLSYITDKQRLAIIESNKKRKGIKYGKV